MQINTAFFPFITTPSPTILPQMIDTPKTLAIIAGKGAYPLLLAESARKQGIERIVAVAFKKETDPAIEKLTDETTWLHVGQLGKMLDAMKSSGISNAVMAGAITPTNLYRVRMDGPMITLLKNLKTRNAETIFGAIADELKKIDIELLPASTFMVSHMPEEGLLSERAPSESELNDINLGLTVAKTSSNLDIGQTVVIKEGTILAVEAFEGTDETIKRAAKLGGSGIVIVKVAKQGHDMRFDIPVIGSNTMKLLKKTKAGVLAVEAGRSILLERENIIKEANNMNLCLTAVKMNGTQ